MIPRRTVGPETLSAENLEVLMPPPVDLPPGVESQQIETSRLRTHVLTAGSPDAPPLLLVHGLNDTNVPPTESQQMYDALHALGRGVELLTFGDDGHEIDKRENRTVLVRAMCDWLTAAFAGPLIS